MISLPEPEFQKQFADIKKGAEDHWEFERKETLRIQKEEEERKKKEQEEAKQRAIEEAKKQAELDRIKAELEAEKKRKLDEEIKKQQEEEARLKAEEEAKKAPIKEKLTKWVDSFSIDNPDSELSANETAILIKEKFESFKVWAKKQIV